MKRAYKLIASLILTLTLNSTLSLSQIVVVDTLSVPDLVNTLVGAGIQVSNITYAGLDAQFAQFDGTASNIGIDKGIILSSGIATTAADPTLPANQQNTGPVETGIMSGNSDVDLTTIAALNTQDAAVIEFDIRPAGDTLRFNYVFGSEEYASFVCSGFNDVFGFFVSGPGITGPYSSPAAFPNGSVNIALLPDGITPVTIDNINNGDVNGVCAPMNSQYYVDNGDGIDPNFTNNNFTTHTFNGTTVKLEAKIPVQVCQLYHLKLAISDVSDQSLNSGVFLESGSFTSKAINLSTAYANVYEGCKDGKIQFQRKDTVEQDTITVYLEYGGDATEGVDYPNMPDSILMGPGSGIYTLQIPSFSDGNVEPGETIVIYIVQDDCFNGRVTIDSIMITLYDEIQMDPGNDTTIYYGDTLQLNAYNPDAEFYAWTPNYAINDTTIAAPIVYPCSTTTYHVNGTDTLGCSGSDSITVSVVQRHPFDLTKLNAFENCDDGEVVFTRNELDRLSETLSYSFTVSGSATSGIDYTPLIDQFTLAPNDTSFTLNINALEDYIYDPNETIKIVLLDSNVCFSNAYPIDSITLLIKDLVIEATDDTLICSGDSIQLTAIGGGSFDWEVDPSFISDTTASNPILFPDSTIKIIVNSNSGNCYKADSLILEVHYFTAQHEDSITLCMRDTIQIGKSAIDGNSYLWTPTIGLNDDTLSNPFLSLNISQDTFYVVTIQDSFSCEDKDTVFVKVLQAPDNVSLLGATSVCPDVTGINYWSNDSTISSFNWLVNGGVLVSGQSTDSIVVDWGSANNNANVQLIPINNLGCKGDTSQYNITINQILQTETPNGPDTLCMFDIDSLSYSISHVNGSIYTWNVSNGSINSGQGNNNVNISWTGVDTAYVFIQEQSNTSSTMCFGQSDTLFIAIHPSPDTNLAIVGDTSLCAFEDSILYAIGGNMGSTYLWTLDTGGTISGNTQNDSLWVNWDSTGVYQLSVFETTNMGCEGKWISHTINIHSLPNTQFLSGDSIVCVNSLDSIQYAISGMPNSTYNWTATQGAENLSGTTDTVYITWDNTSDIKLIKVLETTAYGCTSDSIIKSIQYDASSIKLSYVTDNYENQNLIDIFWNYSTNLDSSLNDLTIYRRQEFPSLGSWDLVTQLNNAESSYQDGPFNTNEEQYQYIITTKNLCADSLITLTHNNIILQGQKEEDESFTTLNWSFYHDWNIDGGVYEYRLYRSVDGDSYEYYTSFEAMDSTVIIENDKVGFNICYRMEAVQSDNTDIVSWSNEACVAFRFPITIYDALTPNGDDKNETFYIENIELYPENDIEIYNRWGNLVYKTKGYNNDWDGGNLPDGTYYYIAKINENGEERVDKGSLLLQR